jgi:hypothetical protein
MYKSRSKIFLSDEFIYYYLLLCMPFSPSSIERILNSILCRFQENFKFYTVFMRNLVKLFEVEELPSDQPPPAEKLEGQKTPESGLLKKPFVKKFIDEVYINLVSIKKVAFDYCEKIWDMSNQKVDSILASRDYDYILMNPCNMAKIIITKTNDADLAMHVHNYIVSIRNNQLFAITSENIIEVDKLLDDKGKH